MSGVGPSRSMTCYTFSIGDMSDKNAGYGKISMCWRQVLETLAVCGRILSRLGMVESGSSRRDRNWLQDLLNVTLIF
ncbi:hypothetical protein TNCV_898751 [Trichonephila clavipes]|nr:hypothetical protein TNCV_898751 [Trichonephila clavipes]